MKLTDFYNAVCRKSDTGKQSLNAADTKRVLATAFEVLEKMDAAEAADTIAKGICCAKKKRCKK